MEGMTVRRAARRSIQALLVLSTTVWAAGVSVTVAPADPNPMSISMTASSNPVASGDELTYTITVQNTGGSRVKDVAMHDQINGMRDLILTSTVGSCGQTDNLVNCDAGILQGGQVWVVTIRGVVTAPEGTTLHNLATVTATKSSQTFTNSASVDVQVNAPLPGGPIADLTVAMNAPATVGTSAPLVYTLTVNNQGTANANDIRVVDTLPAGVTAPVASGTSLFTCSIAALVVTCDGGRVNAGANATITISMGSPASVGTITNTAVVDPNDDIPESNELNNTAQKTTVVTTSPPPGGTLTVAKTDTPDPVNPGDLLSYGILVTNTSDFRATDVTVVDGTQGLDAASIAAATSKGVCVVSAPIITCSQSGPDLRLDPGESLTILITGTVVARAGSQLINTVTVTGNIRNVGVSNTATATTVVKPKFDLTVTKFSSPVAVGGFGDPVRSADDLFYTYVIGNSGTMTATGVVLRDELPAGIQLVKTGGVGALVVPISSGFSCTISASNVLVCTGGTVGSESTATIQIRVIAPETTGDITNTAVVDPDNNIPESDESNNRATITTRIITGIDLTVSKVADFDPVATSGTLTYTITVSNIGTQDATGIVVRDELPSGTRFRFTTEDSNFTCSHSAGVVTCVGGVIDGTFTNSPDTAVPVVDFATITITIFAQSFPGTMTNIVRVDPDNAIPEINEDNNINILTTAVGIGGAAENAFNELTIAKAQDFDPVAPNGVLTYTITIGNDATDTAFNVAVRDFLPVGSRFIRADNGAGGANGGFECTHAGGQVDCIHGTVQPTPANPSKTIIIKIFAPDTPGSYPNTAQVDPDNTILEGNETNNTATVITNVVLGSTSGAFIDLKIEAAGGGDGITDSPDPVATNGLLTYTIHVRNTGSDRAFNVRARAFLPAGSRYFSSSGTGGFFCTESSLVVNCQNGSVDGGGAAETITITVFAPDIPRGYTLQAVVDPENAIPEANEINNTASEDTTVQIAPPAGFIDL